MRRGPPEVKRFSSVVVARHPREIVWKTIRDRLVDLAPLLDGVESITLLERREAEDGAVHLVNLWKATAEIPAILAKVVQPSMLAWVDRAEWRHEAWECRWRIEPRFFPGRIRCSGSTRYEPALGGRGTRITFAGTLEVDLAGVPGLPGFLGAPASGAVESLAIALVPRSFRKLADALSRLLAEDGRGTQGAPPPSDARPSRARAARPQPPPTRTL